MAGAQAAPPARAATRRHGATRTVSIAAHVENLHPHHDGRPCRQRVAPGRLGRPGRRQCGAADRLRPTRPVVPARPPADHAAFGCARPPPPRPHPRHPPIGRLPAPPPRPPPPPAAPPPPAPPPHPPRHTRIGSVHPPLTETQTAHQAQAMPRCLIHIKRSPQRHRTVGSHFELYLHERHRPP